MRDSFFEKADLCKIIMISYISRSNLSSNHTINTLIYSMRLKEKLPRSAFSNNNTSKPIPNKKNNIINKNKNKKFSKSPNIKRNISKNNENFHIVEKEKDANNKNHYSNGNINSIMRPMARYYCTNKYC